MLVQACPRAPCSFQDILVKFKYNGGEPITREFFDEHISGGHNILLGKFLWPDWTQQQRDDFADEKEALFREYSRKDSPPPPPPASPMIQTACIQT